MVWSGAGTRPYPLAVAVDELEDGLSDIMTGIHSFLPQFEFYGMSSIYATQYLTLKAPISPVRGQTK
jgi:hypothetical protein